MTKGVDAVFRDHARGQYFVAESDSKVMASLLITYEWSDWRNSNVWWFQSVFCKCRNSGDRASSAKCTTNIRELAEEQDVAGLRLMSKQKIQGRKKHTRHLE